MDRETVIREIEDALSDNMAKAGYIYRLPLVGLKDKALTDVLALLKEQEAVEPTINEDGEAYCICGENVGIIPSSKNLPSIRSKYCSECGRRMNWKYD